MRIALVQELEGRVLQIDELEKTGRFGSEMLKYNVVGGILGAELHNVDQELRCLYQVRDMITLNEFFEMGNITVIQLTGLLEQLVRILTCCQEYFLDEKICCCSVILCSGMRNNSSSGFPIWMAIIKK